MFSKIFLLFSNNNKVHVGDIINQPNSIIYKEIESIFLEKINNLKFSSANELVSNILKEEKELFKKLELYILKLRLYFVLDLKKEANDLLKFLEENYLNEVKENINYLKIKFYLNLDEETKKKLNILSPESKLEIEKFEKILSRNYEEYLKWSTENGFHDDIDYLRLKMIYELLEKRTYNLNQVDSLLEKIINELTNKKPLEKIKNLIIVIQVYEKSIYVTEYIIKVYDELIKLFEENFLLEESLRSDFEKQLINLYIKLKYLKNISKEDYFKLLERNKSVLDSYNKISLILLEEKGYKKQIEDAIENEEYFQLEIIYNILFFEKKYKYILQNYKEYMNDASEEKEAIELIKVYSKLMIKKKVSEEERKILEKNKGRNFIANIFYLVHLFSKNEITREKFEEEAKLFFEINLNTHLTQIIILRLLYIYNKQWMINILIENKIKLRYLIPEFLKIICTDYEINGFEYEKIINEISEFTDLNYETIGIAYIEYKNLRKGLYFLKKAWKKEKTLRLAKIMLIPLLNLEEYDEEVYKFLRENLEEYDIRSKLQNSLMLSFESFEKAEIEMNKTLLLITDDEIELNMEFFQSIYFKFLLFNKARDGDKNLKYENSLYIESNKNYISRNYPLSKIRTFFYYDEEEFPIFKLEKNIVNLNTFLIMDIVKRGKILERNIPGIIKLDFDENNVENFLQDLEKYSGKLDFDKNCKKYFDGILKSPLIFPNTNIDFVNIFIEKLIMNFQKNYLNKTNTVLGTGVKILSLDSTLFLYKLGVLDYIDYSQIIILKSSILILEKSIYYNNDYLEILKSIRKNKVEIFNDIDINDITREKEIKNFEIGDIVKLFYSCMVKKAIYITEDKNNIFTEKYPTCSSIYLVISQIIAGGNYREEIRKFPEDVKKIIYNILSD
ncbi:MAG: hypothetical protein ACRC6A_01720 [Fusobacteriaceae bacterium]